MYVSISVGSWCNDDRVCLPVFVYGLWLCLCP